MTRTFLRAPTALAVVALLAPATAVQASTGYDIRPEVAAVGDPQPDVRLEGAGWGHGVGMSQYGAYAMSRAGHTHAQIIQQYYGGVTEHRYQAAHEVVVDLFGGGDGQRLSDTDVRAAGGTIDWRVCDDGDCQQLDQSAGSTWHLDVDDGEVRVRDGDRTHTGDEVQVRLTGREDVPGEGVNADIPRVRAASPNGQDREYGYGWLMFTVDPDTNDDRLAMVNRLSMDAYVRGIAEMPSGWGNHGGQAALQAQAVVARTYAYANGRQVCATARCQVFNGLDKETEAAGDPAVAAVRDPAAQVLRAPDGSIAQTFYSSSHGGRTENSEDSWAYSATIPYLRSVDDPWSLDAGTGNPYRSWTATVDNREVADLLAQGPQLTGLRVVEQLGIRSWTDGGTPREIEVRGRDADGQQISGVFTQPGSGRAVAGGHLRTGLTGVSVTPASGSSSLSTLPGSQISRIGFGPFRDDDGGPHEYATVWANEASIAEGFDDGTFRSGTTVSRRQMASFIHRTFDVPASSGDNFADVDPAGPHGAAINALADAGIAEGYEDGDFRPRDPVSRAQMASFLVRAIGLSEVAPDGRFEDVVDGPHAGTIHAIAQAGITDGCRPGAYCPHDTVRRGQMASFLHRTVEGG